MSGLMTRDLAGNGARQALIGMVLSRIADASCARGFDWMVLNGLPQARSLYADLSRRQAGAIDILVAPGQSGQIAAILGEAGFSGPARTGPDATLARVGLRADPRITLRDPGSGESIHLHERLYFAGAGTEPLLEVHRPRRSTHSGDIPAPRVGAQMALDILLRGNARLWAEARWLSDLQAVIGRLDVVDQQALLDAIEAADFAPGAAASLIACRDRAGLELPERLRAWLDPWLNLPEVAVRLAGYGRAPNPMVPGPAPVRRGLWARLRSRGAQILGRRGRFARDIATRLDRYPLAFRFAQMSLAGITRPRLLSFGCSTGEEVSTLRRYFPGAAIKGIDIDPAVIAIARTRLAGDSAVTLEVAGSTSGEPSGGYDAIFCMAVFRDPVLDRPETRRADGTVTYTAFNREIANLVRCLRPDGLLFVEHANFRVASTGAASRLTTVLHADPPRSGLEPGLFGPDGLRLAGVVDHALGFRKTGA